MTLDGRLLMDNSMDNNEEEEEKVEKYYEKPAKNNGINGRKFDLLHSRLGLKLKVSVIYSGNLQYPTNMEVTSTVELKKSKRMAAKAGGTIHPTEQGLGTY